MSYMLDRPAARPRAVQVAALKRTISPASDASAALAGVPAALRVQAAHRAHPHGQGRRAWAAWPRWSTTAPPAAARGRGWCTPITATCSRGISARRRLGCSSAPSDSLARRTDRIVAISPRIRDELLDDYRIGRAEQYRVVPLGFDLAGARGDRRRGARPPPEPRSDIPPARAVVTTVGRLTAIKEQRLFLEAARLVAGEHRPPCFSIAGDGELRAELEASAARVRPRRPRAVPRLAPRPGDHLRRHRRLPADLAQRRHAGRADREPGCRMRRGQHRRRRCRRRDQLRTSGCWPLRATSSNWPIT